MAQPLVPPPANDTGALTYPRQLQRWLDPNPVTKLDRVGTFLTLPSFSVTVNWLGYSDIVAAFNFEAPNNFSLKNVRMNNAAVTPPNYKYIAIPTGQTGSGVTISGSGDAIGNG